MLDYTNPQLIIDSSRLEPGSVTWRSPSNLALIKYWGKHGVQLPRNPSISFTLNNAFTETTLRYSAKQNMGKEIDLTFLFEGEPNEAFGSKVEKFLISLVEIFPFLKQLSITIDSRNSFPHSAGIASSASSMSALALCLCTLEETFCATLNEDAAFDQKASYIARLGSGSACRSIFPTMGVWGETLEVSGSSDLFAVPYIEKVDPVFKTFNDAILIASRDEKSVSSRAGHELMNQNIYADARYSQAKQQLHYLLEALKVGDLETFGRITENEALTLHALMMASNPSYILLKPNTLTMIEKVRAYRQDTKQPVYFSLDAGPNLHLLYPDSIKEDINNFITNELMQYCQNGEWIADMVGEGPIQL